MTPLAPRALITGAGARLGAAMARALGARGFTVALHYRASRDGAEATARAVREAGGEAVLVQADLDREAELAGLMAAACDALGAPPALLVNNASTFTADTARDFTPQSWQAHMASNLYAPCALARDFAARLPAGESGLIVNMIDQRVLRPEPSFFTYTLAKSALLAATRTLAQAFAPSIRVNAIGPGPTLRSIHQSEADFAAEVRATLTREGSPPAEICRALEYLIDATAVTGQMIAVDGGQHLMWHAPDKPD